MGDFEAGLCDCCDDMNVCCCSFFCPCIQFKRNIVKDGSSSFDGLDPCIMFCLLFACPLCTFPLLQIPRATLQTIVRQGIRKDEDKAVSDFFTVWCCMCCALAQESKGTRRGASSGSIYSDLRM